jgi:hypothetical protein
MPTPDFSAIFDQLKKDVVSLAELTVKGYVKEAKDDGKKMLTEMKDNLQRWTLQLSKGDLTTQDFEWLVFSQKDLLLMEGLKRAGLAAIRAEQFKNSVLSLVIDTIFNMIKI